MSELNIKHIHKKPFLIENQCLGRHIFVLHPRKKILYCVTPKGYTCTTVLLTDLIKSQWTYIHKISIYVHTIYFTNNFEHNSIALGSLLFHKLISHFSAFFADSVCLFRTEIKYICWSLAKHHQSKLNI